MALLPTEEYVESDYLLDSDYVGGIADAVGILTRYYDEDYAPGDYVDNEGAVFALTADLTTALQDLAASLSSTASVSVDVGLIKSASSNLNGEFTLGTVDVGLNLGTVNANIIASGEILLAGAFAPTVVAVATRSGEVLMQSVVDFSATASRIAVVESLLNYLAALDAQAARIPGITATFNSTTAISVTAAVTRKGSADFVCSSGFAAEGLNVQFADATLNSEFASSANAIEYQSRFFNSIRPIDFTYYNANGDPASYGTPDPSFTQLENGPGILISSLVNNYLTSDLVDLPQEFAIQVNNWNTYSTSYTYPQTLFTYGNPSSPVLKLEIINASGTIRWRLAAKTGAGTTVFVNSPTTSSQALDQGFPYTVGEWKIARYVSGSNDLLSVKFVKKHGTTITENTPVSIVLTSGLSTPSSADRYFRFYRDTNSSYYLDEFTFHDITSITIPADYLKYGLDSNDPYTAFPNDDNTIAFHSFNNTLLDLTAVTFAGAATLNSTAAVSANLNGVFGISADLEGFASTLTVAAKTGNTLASLDNNTSLSVISTAIKSGAAEFNSNADLTSSGDLTVGFSADLNSNTNLTTAAVITSAGVAQLNSTTDLTSSVTGFTGIIAQLDSGASASSTVTRIKPLSSTLSSAASITVSGDRIRSTAIDLSVAASASSNATRIKPLTATLQGFAATVTSGAMVGSAVVSISNTATLSAEPTVLGAGSVFAEAVATVTATATRIQQFACTVNSAATLNSSPTIAVESSADLISNSTQTATGIKITDIVSNQTIVASAVAAADKFRPFGAELNSIVTANITGVKTTDAVAGLNSSTAMISTVGKIVQGSTDLQAFNSITVRARTIAVEMAVYRVPRETRTYTITTESRTHRVTAENRTYRIKEGA